MWCVIQVKGSQELQIQRQLESAGYQALVPRESRLIRSGGAWMQREYILFPNYVFVETEFKAEDFYKIKGINGVQRFLGDKTSPSTLTFLEEEWVKILNNDGHPLEPTEVTVDEDGNVIILKGILLKFKSRIKSFNKRQRKATFEITVCNEIKEITLSLNVIDTTKPTETNG